MIKQDTDNSNYQLFSLPVDDLDWTKHWLDRLRCDQLLVSVARFGQVRPQIHIRAVESKSRSGAEVVEPVPWKEPFSEGVGQVAATLEALAEILDPPAVNRLVADLRFSAFIEHIASVALADLHPIHVDDNESLHVLRAISDFSQRRLSLEDGDVQLDGVVVCTQYQTTVPLKAQLHKERGKERDWDIYLIRAGAAEVDSLLGKQMAKMSVSLAISPDEGLTEPIDKDNLGDDDSTGSGSQAAKDSDGPEELRSARPDQEDEPEISATSFPEEDPEERQLALSVFWACKRRDIPVSEPDLEKVVVGPGLVAIPLALRAGASIRPIEGALGDLAREVGVSSISVENDPEYPFHVRFIVARRNREFPALPDRSAPLFEHESQSYLGLFLGRTLQGTDYHSFVSSWPHMLVGGSTGSGKTTFLRSMLQQLAATEPGLLNLIVIDGKGEVDYLNILPQSHFLPSFPDVIMGHQDIVEVLDWVTEEELPRRRNAIVELARRNPDQRPRSARELYIESLGDENTRPFSPLLVFVDEFSEIMMRGGKTASRFEQRVQQITQVGRSSLVHLLLATQRPDARVIPGSIKANLDARIALHLPTHHDSMTVLGRGGAEQLLDRGDLIFQTASQPSIRLQGFRS